MNGILSIILVHLCYMMLKSSKSDYHLTFIISLLYKLSKSFLLYEMSSTLLSY